MFEQIAMNYDLKKKNYFSVAYNKEKGLFRISYHKDNNFVDEAFFSEEVFYTNWSKNYDE